MVNGPALGALVATVTAIRPDWHASGIRTALEQAAAETPYPELARIAIEAAADLTARTPAVIPTRCADGWTTTPTPATSQDPHCNHPPGECEHGAPHGHCALCRYPNGMPLERRVSGPGREILRQGYAARAAGDVGTRPTTAHVQHELTE